MQAWIEIKSEKENILPSPFHAQSEITHCMVTAAYSWHCYIRSVLLTCPWNDLGDSMVQHEEVNNCYITFVGKCRSSEHFSSPAPIKKNCHGNPLWKKRISYSHKLFLARPALWNWLTTFTTQLCLHWTLNKCLLNKWKMVFLKEISFSIVEAI